MGSEAHSLSDLALFSYQLRGVNRAVRGRTIIRRQAYSERRTRLIGRGRKQRRCSRRDNAGGVCLRSMVAARRKGPATAIQICRFLATPGIMGDDDSNLTGRLALIARSWGECLPCTRRRQRRWFGARFSVPRSAWAHMASVVECRRAPGGRTGSTSRGPNDLGGGQPKKKCW
jgi:hypothetical protein